MPTLITIASDHAGVELKRALSKHVEKAGYKVSDLGTHDEASVDYPDYAEELVKTLLSKQAQKGILICGSGIGMSIAANRHPTIRAALCLNEEMAQLSRQHNDANVLVLGARFVSEMEATKMVDAFLTTEFAGGRHDKRVQKLR